MFNFNRLILSAVLTLCVLVLPSFALAGNFDSGYRYDPSDTSQAPWKGQDHSGDQARHQQEQLQRQQAEREAAVARQMLDQNLDLRAKLSALRDKAA